MTAAERQARRRARIAAAPVHRAELGLPVIDPRALPLNLDHLRRWPAAVAAFLAERLAPAEYAALVDALARQPVKHRVAECRNWDSAPCPRAGLWKSTNR